MKNSINVNWTLNIWILIGWGKHKEVKPCLLKNGRENKAQDNLWSSDDFYKLKIAI